MYIFHLDALNGRPPFGYRPLLQRLAAELNQKRSGASLGTLAISVELNSSRFHDKRKELLPAQP